MQGRSEDTTSREVVSLLADQRNIRARCADASQRLSYGHMIRSAWLEQRKRWLRLGLARGGSMPAAMPEAELHPAVKSGLPPRIVLFLLALLAAGTRGRYLEQARRFGVWSQAHAPAWSTMATEEQDLWLAEYILDTRDEGAGVQAARDSIAALQLLWPNRKYRLATRVVNGWATMVPPCRAPPVDRAGALALVTVLSASGDMWAGCAALLCFTALLRISEALGLRSCDFVVTPQGTAVIMIRKAKTGDFQRVVVQDVAVVAWVEQYRKRLDLSSSSQALLCGGTYDKFRRRLSKAATAIGMGNIAWRSHSFRRGGATTLFSAGLPVQDIAVYGRWLTLSSCSLYLAAGEQELLALLDQRSREARQRIALLASLCGRVLEVGVPGG